MAETSKHCVDAAIAYANEKQHEGNGYFLRIMLENGTEIEGAVLKRDGEHPNVLTLEVRKDFKKPSEVFIDKSRVVTASVLW